MNVTVKLPDELCREARHRAVDESKSLSAWLADLIERELRAAEPDRAESLVERLGDHAYLDRDLPSVKRSSKKTRKVHFP